MPAEVSQRVRGGDGQRAGRRRPSCEPRVSLVWAADGHELTPPPEDRVAVGVLRSFLQPISMSKHGMPAGHALFAPDSPSPQ